MNTVNASIYGCKQILQMLLGHTPKADAKTSQNERLNILANAVANAGERAKLGILMTGNWGHSYQPGVGGIPLTNPNDHYSDDASLFNPMPFCLRLVDEDLPLNQRLKYALRTEMEYHGLNYYAYFGLRVHISEDDVSVDMLRITTEPNSMPIEEPFVPNNSNLFPQPRPLPVEGAVTTTDVKYAARALVPVTLNESDVAEFVNVAKIIYGGDERYAIMSEFLLCTGVDRSVPIQTTSGTTQFLESIVTVGYSFALEHRALYYNDQELNLTFDIGNQVPMLGTASIPTLTTIP